MKGDIANATSTHNGKCPVKTSNPRMFLAFTRHDEVEKKGINNNDNQ